MGEWEQWGLLTSDNHYDSTKCNRELMTRHFRQAQERNAFITIHGDFFDVMQGKYDVRKSYDEIRPEYTSERYLDEVVDDAVEYLKPYADNIAVWSRGNHESSILSRQSTDLVRRACKGLGIDDRVGGYGGWLRLMMQTTKTRWQSIRYYYHHGAGGGGPVTRGVIQTNRQAVYLPDADIIVNGHTHDSWILPIARHRMSHKGVLYQDYQQHVRIPGYKNDFDIGSSGWWVEKWGPPKPTGAIWMRLYHDPILLRVVAEFTPALG